MFAHLHSSISLLFMLVSLCVRKQAFFICAVVMQAALIFGSLFKVLISWRVHLAIASCVVMHVCHAFLCFFNILVVMMSIAAIAWLELQLLWFTLGHTLLRFLAVWRSCCAWFILLLCFLVISPG